MDYRQNPHVKIIKQCAAAVAEGLDPEVAQFKDMQGEWHTANTLECGMPFIGWENFETGNIRIKPRTIVVHGVELPEPLSEAPLGAAVLVDGKTVAWFAEFTESANEWCTENYFGQWLAWRAMPPEIVPLTSEELTAVEQRAAELHEFLNIKEQS